MTKKRQHLNRLEEIFEALGFHVRYEKGNFRSGACVVNGDKTVLVNQHFTIDTKIESLKNILRSRNFSFEKLDQEQKEFLRKTLKVSEESFEEASQINKEVKGEK